MGSGSKWAQTVYRVVLRVLAETIGPARVRVLEARVRQNRKIDLKNPRTLADKVSWLEFNTDQTVAAELSDKIAVRNFVESRGLGRILIPMVGEPWSSASDVDLSGMPEQFVMKAAHGSGMNLLCRNFSQQDVTRVERLARSWLAQDYPRAPVEPHYSLIPRRVYCEEYLFSPGGLIDYKLHCINGEPRFILATGDRGDVMKRGLFDLDWRPISGLKPRVLQDTSFPRPDNLDDMIAVSRNLAEGVPFVRVDLYNVNGHVYFGELTFSPAGGTFDSFTDAINVRYGEEMILL